MPLTRHPPNAMAPSPLFSPLEDDLFVLGEYVSMIVGNPYSEPNGDYTPGCWLGTDGSNINPTEGFGRFNDGNCNYSSGSSYICLDNAK